MRRPAARTASTSRTALTAGVLTAGVLTAGLVAADPLTATVPPVLSRTQPAARHLAAPAVPGEAPVQRGRTAPSRRSFTLVAGGDVLIHSSVWRRAQWDGGGRRLVFAPILAGITPRVRSADLAICHLEVPLAPWAGPYRGYPRFSAPPQVTLALRQQGWDSCSTASNHSLDQGWPGVARTLATLDAVGLRHAGTARSWTEAARPTLLRANGVPVAALSFSFGFNGLPRPAPFLANAIADGRILPAAAAARRAGAQVVVVSLHWGREYDPVPTGQQLVLARRLLASPLVDLIIGHHAHVVQPVERVGGKWVAYGMGNLVAAKSHNRAGGATHEGILPRFTFTETRRPGHFLVTAVDVAPTLIDTAGPLRVRLTRSVPALARARMAYARTSRVVLARGAARSGLTIW